jgi:hypothetical protein
MTNKNINSNRSMARKRYLKLHPPIGEKNSFFGKHHSKESRDRISKSRLARRERLGYINPPSAREKLSKRFLGSGGSNWKGGICPLRTLIRCYRKNKIWTKKIFCRDKYTCQECFEVGGNLEAHHIKTFSKILQEFLKEYSYLSPISDKEILFKLAIHYKPFWDINNGKTLCKECHKKWRKPRNDDK